MRFFEADDIAMFRRTGIPSLLYLNSLIGKSVKAREYQAKRAKDIFDEVLRNENEQERIDREAEFKEYDNAYLEEYNKTIENPCPICLECDDALHTMKTLDCGCNVHLACIAISGELKCPTCQEEIEIETFRNCDFFLKNIDITILHSASVYQDDGANLDTDRVEYYYVWICGEYLALITGFNQRLRGSPKTLTSLRRSARGMQWNLE